MDKEELKSRIKNLVPQVYRNMTKADIATVEYDELTKFPELKNTIVDLLSHDYNSFLSSIDWVAPKPTTFRINLKNDQFFYLIYNERSWIAQVEGKKYYLLNLPEEQRAIESISRILRYGAKDPTAEPSDVENMEDIPIEEPTEDTEEENIEI